MAAASKSDVVKRARTAALRRARVALERLVPDDQERELYAESVARYVDAVELGAKLRREWAELGEPALEMGSMRQPIPHPLIRMIADADAAAARYAGAIGLDPSGKVRRVPGRPVGASSAPDRRDAPPKLRLAK